MTARWGIEADHQQPATRSSEIAPRPEAQGAGPWSLMATLDRLSADLFESEQRADPRIFDHLRLKLDAAAQNMRARGRTDLADTLRLAESTLGRVAAVSMVRKAELDLLARIARELPSLLIAGSTRPAAFPRALGPSVARARARALPGDGVPRDRALLDRSIVIVNEDREIGWSQSQILHDAGAQVRLAFDGNDALELSRKVIPDVIVADAFMSGLDGVALARSLRRQSLLRDVGIILVGARRGLLERLAKLGAAADGYLLEKADAATIVSSVTRAIESRRLVETQLASPGEVHGSLTSIAPRTLLVATARLRPDSTITLRQGTDQFEIEVQGGALTAVRMAAGGSSLVAGREARRKCLSLRYGDFSVV
jgi:DNA-binding response OmpR family regulator